MGRTFALDIETLGVPTQWVRNLRHEVYHKMTEEIEFDRPPEMKGNRKYIDSRLTDVTKIDKAIQARLAEGANLDHPKDALNPLTAEPICVVCINPEAATIIAGNGKVFDNDVQVFTDMGKFYHWASQEVDQFIGFNIDQFDIPVLRMHQARITHGIVSRVRAFWNSSIDLRKVFGDIYNKSEVLSTPRDLRHYVATILDREVQQDGVVKEYLTSTFTGADVGSAYVDWEKGGKEKIIRHCTLDTLMVALIAVKLGIYR